MTTFDEADHPRAADGTFASKPEPPEVGERLTLPPAPELVGHPAVVELGPLDPDQKRLLAALLDPRNDDAGMSDADSEYDMAEMYEDEFHGYDGMDTWAEAQQVADRLRTYYDRELNGHDDEASDDAGAFTFGFESDTDGVISGFTVGVYTGYRNGGGYLVTASEAKHITARRDAKGIEAALGYAEALDHEYQRMLAKAQRVGLVTTPAQRDAERFLREDLRSRLLPASLPPAAAAERRLAIDLVFAALRERGVDLPAAGTEGTEATPPSPDA